MLGLVANTGLSACNSSLMSHLKRMAAQAKRPRFESLDPQLRDLYRNATPTQKLAVVARLNTSLIELKSADLQSRFPAMPPAKRRDILRQWWLGARD